MFKFLYVTDLHGWAAGYEGVRDIAVRRGISTIVNGGDMLPKEGQGPESQRIFIEEFLAEFVEDLAANGVQYLGMFGNDDLRSVFAWWQQMLTSHGNARELTDRWHRIGRDLIIRGCSYVPDHPFGLKDWSVRDTPDFQSPPQLGRPLVSTATGFEEIEDIEEFLARRPTLEEILDQMADDAPSLDRAVLVCHAPSAATGQGCIVDGTDVGSPAVRRWIESRQPLLTLHGHIHESPEVTGVHTVRLNRTVVHQPGQHVALRSAKPAVTASVVAIDGHMVNVDCLRIVV